MSSTPDPTSDEAPATTSPKRSSGGPSRGVLLVLMAVLLGAGGVLGYYYHTEIRSIAPVDFVKSIRGGVVNPDKLDPRFQDAHGNMVADPPPPGKRVDPETLVFSTLDTNIDKAKKEWKEFLAHLEKATGKKVELMTTGASGHDIANHIKEGKLHIAMLSTGTVPMAVNTAGFVPCCVMADEKGNFAYQMEILVPAKSKIQTPAEIKGSKVYLTSMSSLSSFKAPVVYLWKEQHLRPDVDYDVLISEGQVASIRGLVKGKFPVVAVASDLLARVVREDKIDPDSFRVIYKSGSYPPACFGYAHDLEPELAAKIRKAFLDFDWKGTALKDAYKAANQTRFVEVSYKKDWAAVREIDKSILEMIGE